MSQDRGIKNTSPVSDFDDFSEEYLIRTYIDNLVQDQIYDANSQAAINRLQGLLKKASEEIKDKYETTEIEEKIGIPENKCFEKYPELVSHFEKWKSVRENLVQLLRHTAEKLYRNSIFLSFTRILMSTIDIFSVVKQMDGKYESSWAGFALEHTSAIGLGSVILEIAFSEKECSKLRTVIKEDQEHFRRIAEWFEQTKKLDYAMQSIFPYGIDKDVALQIGKHSDFEDYNKIHMSIVMSNVKRDARLLLNRDFMMNADRIASSDMGRLWLNKILMEHKSLSRIGLYSEIFERLRINIHPTANIFHDQLLVQWLISGSTNGRQKILFDITSIISAGSNLLFNNASRSDYLKKTAERLEEELGEIGKVIRVMKSPDLELKLGPFGTRYEDKSSSKDEEILLTDTI